MYRNLDSSDINDNKLSFFSKRRVIEDSLPSYLFALAVETLAIAARQNKDVEFFRTKRNSSNTLMTQQLMILSDVRELEAKLTSPAARTPSENIKSLYLQNVFLVSWNEINISGSEITRLPHNCKTFHVVER